MKQWSLICIRLFVGFSAIRLPNWIKQSVIYRRGDQKVVSATLQGDSYDILIFPGDY